MAGRCRTEHCSYCVPRVEKPSSGTRRSFLGPSTYVSLETIHLVGGLEGVLLGICILEKFPSYIWLILLAESHWSRRENDLHALHVKMSLAARPWVRFRSESLRPGNLPAQPENSRGRVLSWLINTMWIWRGGFPRGTQCRRWRPVSDCREMSTENCGFRTESLWLLSTGPWEAQELRWPCKN